MYSKPKLNPEGAIRIPENYGGNAFQGESTTPSVPIEQPTESPVIFPEEAEQTKDVTDGGEAILSASDTDAKKVFKKVSPFSSLLPPRFATSRGGLLGDIGIEELLIIGILILLSQSETDDDILLLLMLLLFYK